MAFHSEWRPVVQHSVPLGGRAGIKQTNMSAQPESQSGAFCHWDHHGNSQIHNRHSCLLQPNILHPASCACVCSCKLGVLVHVINAIWSWAQLSAADFSGAGSVRRFNQGSVMQGANLEKRWVSEMIKQKKKNPNTSMLAISG